MTDATKRMAVLGAGSIGTALAQVAAENGYEVRVWSVESSVLEDIRDNRRNSKHLPELTLSRLVNACWKIEDALRAVDIVMLAVPSHAVREVSRLASPHLAHRPIVLNIAKGLERDTNLRMSEVMAEEMGPAMGGRAVSMGGPAIALDIVRHWPTAVITGSDPPVLAGEVQRALQNEYFKVEVCSDVIGVELGATLKNPYAIALGICDGLGFGTNTKAFMGTLAIEEMEPLIESLGGKPETTYGLAGLGDLITTGFSPHSRNRTLGEKLVTDDNWQDYVKRTTVEGIAACRAGKSLANGAGTKTPLLDVVHGVLFDGKPAAETMREFVAKFCYGLP